LYLLRDNSLIKVSTDHSFVGFLEETGRLSEEAAMRHPKRNEINKALGMQEKAGNQEDFIETGESPFLPGDTLMLCSDGLTDMLDRKHITDILVREISLEEKCDLLIEAANAEGGKDNITVVLVNNDKSRIKHAATRPAPSAKQKIKPENQTASGEKEVAPQNESSPRKKKGGTTVVVLSVLCLVFLTSFLWYLWKDNSPATIEKKPDQQLVKKNQGEIKLQSALDELSGDTLILSDSLYGQTILISDTIFINRDSLFMKSSGNIRLEKDRSYSGPAFVINSNAKNIVLDSLSFHNFSVAISSPAQALVLKNTRFVNCPVAVQTIQLFPQNQYVNGRLKADSYIADSIPVSLPR